MNLDCNTPTGRGYILQQHRCLEIFCDAKQVRYITTDDRLPADVDAILFRDKVLGVAEVKARNMTHEQLLRFGSYLVTYQKLEKLAAAAAALQCSGLLLVYLIPDKRVVWWRVCDRFGVLEESIAKKRTMTAATCNGGVAHRENAFLQLDKMLLI